ncbi:hypothetical protein ACLX1H_007816 [Fusarium chlamydosporum]
MQHVDLGPCNGVESQLDTGSPFKQKLLNNTILEGTRPSQGRDNYLISLLPASWRIGSERMIAETPPLLDDMGNEVDVHKLKEVLGSVRAEVDLDRLSDIHELLWLAGPPLLPRPLHQQHLMKREIVITERLDLHLVWTPGRIFIKPLPRFLLEPRFWERFLSCDKSFNTDLSWCDCKSLRERCLGLFFSYVAIITHESDFHIAKENHLIPEDVHWMAWRAAARELVEQRSIYRFIDPRFHYGELHLSRLNKIFFFRQGTLRGLLTRSYEYSTLLQDSLTWLASSIVFIAVILTAMQVGLATEALQGNKDFQSASYGFTILSLLWPLAVTGFVLVIIFCGFISDCITTQRCLKRRTERMKEE